MGAKDNIYTSKKYLVVFGVYALVLLSCIGLVSFLVDPFFQFRANPDSRYFLNARLVNGGLAKNYDYNLVILGSSMAQNYNLSILKEKDASLKPLKLSTGGMNIPEMEYLYTFVDKGKAKSLIVNLDIPQFNNPYEEMRYPNYLYDNGVLNKLEYLYGYETFVRFAPIDVGLTLYLKDKKDISPKYRMKTVIDEIGNNSLEATYGAKQVKDLYLSGQTVSYQHLIDIETRMMSRLDSMLVRMEIDKFKETQYIFILPPYSALYWNYAKEKGYYKQFCDFLYYLNRSMEKYNNVKVLCFFDIEEITDLNNYSDVTHFSPKLSDKILENIDNSHYVLNSSTIDAKLHRLDSLANVFYEKNKDWLSK